jgi:hypothetical protein
MKDVERDYRTTGAILRRSIYGSRLKRPSVVFSPMQQYGRDDAEKTYEGKKDHLAPNWPIGLIMAPLYPWVAQDSATYSHLGRPWLTVCLDAETRKIISYSITFEPPSLRSILFALKRASLSPPPRRKPHPYNSEDWDVWGLPRELLLSRSPSIAERPFRKHIFHKLPEGIPHNSSHMPRAGHDSKKAAMTAPSDLDALIRKHIDFYNRNKYSAWRGGRPRSA